MASYMLKKVNIYIIMEKHNQQMHGAFLKLQISLLCLMRMFPKTIVPHICTLKLPDWTLDACPPHFYIFVFYIHKLIIDLIHETLYLCNFL